MAEEIPTTPAEDPYDIAQSEPAPSPVESVQPSASAEDSSPAEAPKSERPRNPDGTFAKVEKSTFTHPPMLHRLAQEYGYDEDEILSTPSEQLSLQLLRIQRNLQQVRQDNAAQRVAQEGQVQTPDEPVDIGLTPEDEGEIHPGIVKALKNPHKKIKELEARLAQAEEREKSRAAVSAKERIDDAFASLPEKFHKMFGIGTYDELVRKDPSAVKRRNAALSAAGVDLQHLPPPRVLVQKLQAGATDLFMVEEDTGYKTNGKVKPPYDEETWNQSGAARPTHRHAEDLPLGEQRAIKALEKRMGADALPSKRIDDMGFLG